MKATWRRRLVLAKLKRIDRDSLVRILAGQYRLASLAWWRQQAWRWLMAGLSPNDVFEQIYVKNIWGNSESKSGFGSTLDETANLRRALPDLLQTLDARVLLDVPCGDFNWMSTVDLGNISYVGADIVPDLVAEAAEKYSGANRQFLCLDLISDALPRADVILCRDCLVHLPNREACKVLSNIRSSGASYLLTTTFPGQPVNQDIAMGHWRPVNLERPPFNLPRPITVLHESNPDPSFADKSLGLWRVSDLPKDLLEPQVGRN